MSAICHFCCRRHSEVRMVGHSIKFKICRACYEQAAGQDVKFEPWELLAIFVGEDPKTGIKEADDVVPSISHPWNHAVPGPRVS
jgi:hypothetical protein